MKSRQTRSCIANAISAAVEENGQRYVGSVTGHASSTISRWGSDLNAWPFAAVLDLAEKDPALRNAIADAIQNGEKPRVLTAETAAMVCIRSSSELNQKIAAAMIDQRLDADERAALIPDIDENIRQLTIAKNACGGVA